jgi:hypothetical protein
MLESIPVISYHKDTKMPQKKFVLNFERWHAYKYISDYYVTLTTLRQVSI